MPYPTILEDVFMHYSNDQEFMVMSQYTRFAIDCKLLDKKISKAEIGHIFVKNADQQTKLMDFNRFKGTFTDYALKKNLTRNDIAKLIEAFGKKLFYNDPFAWVKPAEVYGAHALASSKSEDSLRTSLTEWGFRSLRSPLKAWK